MNPDNHHQTHLQQQDQTPAQASSKARGVELVAVQEIVIVRVEGRVCDAIKPGEAYRFGRWQDARNHLQLLCLSLKPTMLGYDKCDFRVRFADGFVYHGRYDAAHPDSACHETPQLGQHIEAHLRFLARVARPAWITPSYWQALIDQQPAGEREDALRLLATYSLRD